MLLSSNTLSSHPLTLLPVKTRGCILAVKAWHILPKCYLYLALLLKWGLQDGAEEQVLRSPIFCMRQKTTEKKKKGIQIQLNQHQRYIRCRNSGEKTQHFIEIPKLKEWREGWVGLSSHRHPHLCFSIFTCRDTRVQSQVHSRGQGRWRSAEKNTTHTGAWWLCREHWLQSGTSGK